jgi:hypothetical protein
MEQKNKVAVSELIFEGVSVPHINGDETDVLLSRAL